LASRTVDLLVIGGGIHGAAIARDAAGRGIRVMLAEKGDYASATSSATTKLVHGGLRYLEQLEFGLVRESLSERAELLQTAPHLTALLRFLVPIYAWQRRSPLILYAGLKLYDLLSARKGLPYSGRLPKEAIANLPRLVRYDLKAVLHYDDCQTDDARLTLSVLLDARARGADILNRRAVTQIRALENGYAAEMNERGHRGEVLARFIVNAGGPFVAEIDALCDAPPPTQALRLVRGSHIVLPNPAPQLDDAFTLQAEDGRIVFVIPWQDRRYLLVGTTDVLHQGDPSDAVCSPEERDYLLGLYNLYFAGSGRAAPADILWSFAGVRALVDHAAKEESRLSRRPSFVSGVQGGGGMISLYGGKLTTHRVLAEQVLAALQQLGAPIGAPWTKGVPLYGGSLSRAELSAKAEAGPEAIPLTTRRRWAFTYGDRIEALYERAAKPEQAREIAPGLPRAELSYAAEMEDALTAEDFLLRRTKLHLDLDDSARAAISQWFT
jgi:glycerol-3-phosphate dehydrogenase